MPNVITRILAAIGFAYIVLSIVGHYAPNLHKAVAVAIAMLCGIIVSLACRDRKPAERDNA